MSNFEGKPTSQKHHVVQDVALGKPSESGSLPGVEKRDAVRAGVSPMSVTSNAVERAFKGVAESFIEEIRLVHEVGTRAVTPLSIRTAAEFLFTKLDVAAAKLRS